MDAQKYDVRMPMCGGVSMCGGHVYLCGVMCTCVDLCEFFIGPSILIFKYMYLMCMHV